MKGRRRIPPLVKGAKGDFFYEVDLIRFVEYNDLIYELRYLASVYLRQCFDQDVERFVQAIADFFLFQAIERVDQPSLFCFQHLCRCHISSLSKTCSCMKNINSMQSYRKADAWNRY